MACHRIGWGWATYGPKDPAGSPFPTPDLGGAARMQWLPTLLEPRDHDCLIPSSILVSHFSSVRIVSFLNPGDVILVRAVISKCSRQRESQLGRHRQPEACILRLYKWNHGFLCIHICLNEVFNYLFFPFYPFKRLFELPLYVSSVQSSRHTAAKWHL